MASPLHLFCFFCFPLQLPNPVYVDKFSYLLGGSVPIEKQSIPSCYFYPKYFTFILFQYCFRKFSICKFEFGPFESLLTQHFEHFHFLVLVEPWSFSLLFFFASQILVSLLHVQLSHIVLVPFGLMFSFALECFIEYILVLQCPSGRSRSVLQCPSDKASSGVPWSSGKDGSPCSNEDWSAFLSCLLTLSSPAKQRWFQ